MTGTGSPGQHQGRELLRQSTKVLHHRLDALISDADLARRPGLTAYLGMNADALCEIKEGLQPDRKDWVEMLEDLSDAAQMDLATLGVPPVNTSTPALGNTWSLGAMYVVAGSRLGARVLYRRVQASEDDQVARATAFFGPRAIDRVWPKIVRELDAVQDGQSDAVVRDARAAFALFERAFRAASFEDAQI